jgi:hypothetical protein
VTNEWCTARQEPLSAMYSYYMEAQHAGAAGMVTWLYLFCPGTIHERDQGTHNEGSGGRMQVDKSAKPMVRWRRRSMGDSA